MAIQGAQLIDRFGLTPAWTPLRFHAVQFQVMTSDVRFLAVPAGRGSGKTEIAKRKLALSMMAPDKRWPDPRFFYAADTVGHAKQIAWESMLSLLPPHMILGKPKESADSLEVRLKNNAMLRLFGTRAPQRMEGLQWNGGVIDESSDCSPGVFDKTIVPALIWRRGWCWRIGVPKRFGIGGIEYRKFYEMARDGKIRDAAAFTWHSKDIVPAEELEQARRMLDPKDYREQFEASWESAGGGMFWSFDWDRNRRPCQYDAKRPLSIACDFNMDPMCWCLAHRYVDRVEWIDEVFLRDANTQAILDVLWDRWHHHRGGFEFFGDAASHQRKTSANFTDYAIVANDRRFWTNGRPQVFIPRGNPPIVDRIAACNAMFLNAEGKRRMFVSPGCVHLLEDLRVRHFKEGTNEPEDSGDVGHMTDAMGYLVWCCYPIRMTVQGQTGGAAFVKHGA